MARHGLGLVLAILTATATLAEAPKIGQKAPDFSLTDVKGQTHTLADARGKKAVVLVWISTRCPVSNAYNERLKALYQGFADRGVLFLAINSNVTEPLGEVKAHAADKGFPFAVLKDGDCGVADAYGVTHTPEVFVLDSDLVLRYHGAVDNNRDLDKADQPYARQALEAVLAGKAPDPAEVASFGCSIKRS